ncbi:MULTISPECIES: type II toxin-antitoxin system CcdA family antitoxin [unclassified Rhizobium]|uniref:type II toxin-antitoxin system CcdA family antitoxin n=1 Tax=unclassified Rhizobium TaxID=2613769 RepID=UPI0007EE8D9A|nr:MULTISPECIES: type II toxin-antitoxin system CcdA family antitoxin [unclassified Rhizobium]
MKAEQPESLDRRQAQIPIPTRAAKSRPSIKRQAIMKRCREERERLWRIENAEAIAEQNEYVAKHGLPFAKYRQF